MNEGSAYCVDLGMPEMDGEARFLLGVPSTETPRRNRGSRKGRQAAAEVVGLIDVKTDRHGEYFELRLLVRRGISATVVDEDRDERCLLLLLREGARRASSCAAPTSGTGSWRRCRNRYPASGRWRRRISRVSPEEFDALPLSKQRGDWVEMVRNPELYAKREVRHPDHNTIVLHYWHRVLMSTEQGARAMQHVAVLD
jgi:hypothetical protein